MRRLPIPLLLIGLFVVLALLPLNRASSSSPIRQDAAENPDTPFGINSHLVSRYPEPDSMETPVELIHQIHASWVREDFQISRIMPEPDQFDWSFPDRNVDLMTARGVHIIGVLNGPTPAWAAPGTPGGDFFAPDPQQFARFASAVVERYKGRVRYWQVWSEPDNVFYWKPAPDPAAYAELLKVAYRAIKEADPKAQVLAAGFVSPEPAISFLSAIASHDAWGAFDIVAVHPYADPKAPEDGQVDAFGVRAVQILLDRLGSKPIWATEIGWSTGSNRHATDPVDEETQANYLIRALTMLRTAGAERIIWYNLKDDDLSYGLVRFGAGNMDYSSEQLKPALFAFKTLNLQLEDTTPAGRIELGQRQTILDFEQFGTWQRGDQPNGELTQSDERVYAGAYAAKLSYTFNTDQNDYVVFFAQPTVPIASPSQLGAWVYGDGSGHELKVWLRDAEGELLQFRLGAVGGTGWQFVATTLNGLVEPGNVIDKPANRRLDLPAELFALVLDDAPNSATGQGTIYIDDLTAISGDEAYGLRFAKGDEVVDVLWSPTAAQVAIPTSSETGVLTDKWGGATEPAATDHQFNLTLGPSPIFLRHLPALSSETPNR